MAVPQKVEYDAENPNYAMWMPPQSELNLGHVDVTLDWISQCTSVIKTSIVIIFFFVARLIKKVNVYFALSPAIWMRAFNLCIVIITCDLWTCMPGFGYLDCIDGHNSLGNMKVNVIFLTQQFGKYET